MSPDAYQLVDAVAHLIGGFVCESDRENLPRFAFFFVDEIGDAIGDDARFAAARTREYEHGTVDGRNRVALRFIQVGMKAFNEV